MLMNTIINISMEENARHTRLLVNAQIFLQHVQVELVMTLGRLGQRVAVDVERGKEKEQGHALIPRSMGARRALGHLIYRNRVFPMAAPIFPCAKTNKPGA
jgi:hypothetical protein